MIYYTSNVNGGWRTRTSKYRIENVELSILMLRFRLQDLSEIVNPLTWYMESQGKLSRID